jgi:2-methylcitrate dehydratase PrpD
MAPARSRTEALVSSLLGAYDSADKAPLAEAAGRLLFDHWACRGGADALLPPRWRAEPVARHAAAGCLLDRDDLHWASLTHPGSIIWPVVLDVGTRMAVEGAAAVRAATLGYEVVSRLAATLGPTHRRYWHSTATAGTVGAAMSAALLLGLDPEGIGTALGHAISVTGGSSRAVLERSATKLFHRAHAATTGIACAEAASLAPATRLGLESEQGMLHAMSASADPAMLDRPVGVWAIEDTTIRLYAVTGFAHTAVEAASGLAGKLDSDDIRRVRLSVSATTRALASVASPTTDEEAWWSVQHAVATCLVHGDAAVLETGLQSDARVRWLLERIEFDADRDDIGATCTVEREDGSLETNSMDVPVGHPTRPASTEQLIAKWSAVAGDGADRAWAAVAGLGSERLKAVVQKAGATQR